jgi:Protein of unknwon function (DUF3310).
MAGALDVQVGGGHYKKRKIQPVEYIHANDLGFLEGCIIKRITRWRDKDGFADLEKIKHEVDLLIQLETSKQAEKKGLAARGVSPELRKATKDFLFAGHDGPGGPVAGPLRTATVEQRDCESCAHRLREHSEWPCDQCSAQPEVLPFWTAPPREEPGG